MLEDRMQRAMVRPARFADERAISEANSKLYNRIDDALDELAGRLVGEVLDSRSFADEMAR
jgi:hypothetical protein